VIVFDLQCRAGGHRFEGWFGSSDDFATQSRRGLVECPECGSSDVAKAPMAPYVGRKANSSAAGSTALQPADRVPAVDGPAPGPAALPPAAMAAMRALAALQAEAITHSRWVGESLAEESRAMHYGEREQALIHGRATREQAEDLLEEGIALVPLLIPIAPPDQLN
jgi:hypothetical protein